jgi:hypothetical protein
MDSNEVSLATLWNDCEGIASYRDLSKFVALFASLRPHSDQDKLAAASIFNHSLQKIVEVTRGDPREARLIMQDLVLPICLESTESGLDFTTVRATDIREMLSSWVDRYPDGVRSATVNGLYRSIMSAKAPARPKLHTILALGTRTPQIWAWLETVAAQRNEVENLAIRCMASLGPTIDEQEHLVRLIMRRRSSGLPTDFDFAIHRLGDPRFIPLLIRNMSDPSKEWWLPSLLGRIAEAHYRDPVIQRKVWKAFEKAMRGPSRKVAFAAGGGISKCDDSRVVEMFLEALSDDGDKTLPIHQAFNQLKSCVRSEQLEGWKSHNKFHWMSLADTAKATTGNTTRSMTLGDHQKRNAWSLALMMGKPEVLDWLEPALEQEGSFLTKASMIRSVACLRFDALPPTVVSLLTTPGDLKRNADANEYFARQAATNLAHSQGTREALRYLVEFPFTSDGHPFLSVSEMAKDLACRLAKQQQGPILDLLTETANDKELGNRRMLAICAIRTVAEILDATPKDDLLLLAQDKSLPEYALAEILGTLALRPYPVKRQQVISFLVDTLEAPQPNWKIRYNGCKALIAYGLARRYFEVIMRALGGNLAISLDPRADWKVDLLADLAFVKPSLLPVLKRNIRANWGSLSMTYLYALRSRLRKAQRVPRRFVLWAPREHARRLRPEQGGTGQFALFAELLPSDFVRIPWEKRWNKWMPPVRAALAAAMSEAHSRATQEDQGRAEDILALLLGDSSYEVRRSAGRALFKVKPHRMASLLDAWVLSGNADLRRNAAEQARWISFEPEGHLNHWVSRLLWDSDAGVRRIAAESAAELRNQTYGKNALSMILGSERGDANRWVLECYCYGAAVAEVAYVDAIDALEEIANDLSTPPNVSNWLRQVVKDTEEKFKELSAKWPQPSFGWSGHLEIKNRGVEIESIPLKRPLSLWRSTPSSVHELTSWGGAFDVELGSPLADVIIDDKLNTNLTLKVGPAHTRILITSGVIGGKVSFVGNGDYPIADKRAPQASPATGPSRIARSSGKDKSATSI